METRRLIIDERKRTHPIMIVSPDDFGCRDRAPIEPEEVFRDPRFSLYCFDLENDSAIFVEVDDPEAVDRAAFYYQGQAEHAVGLARMPLETFHAVAERAPAPPKGFIFVHSVGRCGSTLLSKALAAIPSVHSLSEPDDLTQVGNFRHTGKASDEEVRAMIESSVKWRGKPRAGKPAESVAIKTRSEVLSLADLVGSLFPNEKHLFLYRNALTWMGSIVRGWPSDRDVYDAEMNRKMEDGWSRTLPMIKEYRREEAPMNPVQIRTLAWITCMEGYLKLHDMGVPTCAARFEDLTAQPEPVLKQIFDFCEIERVDWEAMRDVLSRDSQAGTIYDREERRKKTRELTPELWQDVSDMVATRPRLRTPDVVVPQTVEAAISRK